MCTAFIYRHIRNLPPTQIFSTRDVLIYGKRSSVDATLCRMVKEGFITRLARGIFVRDARKKPTVLAIASAKAKAFGLTIVEHAERVLSDLKLSRTNKKEFLYAKTGSSTSFWTIHGRVHLKGVCEKKLALVETRAGQVVYALWHLGRQNCEDSDINTACANLKRYERKELWLTGSKMPSWLFERCRHWYPRLEGIHKSKSA
jgi:hypothetical protein